MLAPTKSRSATVKRLAVMTAVPALLLALSACSAGAGAGGGASSSEKPSASPGSLAEWQLKMSRCMREQGVNVPDPSGDGTGAAMNSNGASQDQISAASKTCADKLGTPPAMTNAEKKQAEEAAQKALITIAKCYRASGIDVPDPQPGQGLDIPKDAPADVTEKCGGAGSTTTSAG
jgi:hypothetical protein